MRKLNLKKSSNKISAQSNATEQNRKKLSKNFFDCVKPVYESSKKFGLMIFSIKYSSNGEMENCEVHCMHIIWFIVSVSLFLSLTVFSAIVLVPVEYGNIRTTIFVRGRRVLMTINLILCAISTISNMLNRHRLIDMMKMINSYDKEVHQYMYFIFSM